MNPTHDPLGVRRDFPAAERGVYLNSAYITPHPTAVLEVGRRFLEAKSTGPISMEEMLDETDRARGAVAGLIGAVSGEIGFLDATSAGENVLARALDLGPGDSVVVDELHYDTSYLLYGRLRDTCGVDLRVAPQRGGRVDPAEVEVLVDDSTRIVSVAWIAHQNGFRHDLKALSEIAHAKGALLYVDAIQGLGTLPLNVRDEGVDVLSAGAFKWLLGGFGTAAFYVREELLERVSADRLGAMHIVSKEPAHRFKLFDSAKKFEYASLAFPSIYQLRAGVEYLMDVGVAAIEEHAVGLAHRTRAGLARQGFEVLTPEGNRSTIVSFAHGCDVGRVRSELGEANVHVTLREDGAQVRVSPALFNNQADVDALLAMTAAWSPAMLG